MLSRGVGIIIVNIPATNLSLLLKAIVKEAVILLVSPLTSDVKLSDIPNSLERIFQQGSSFSG